MASRKRGSRLSKCEHACILVYMYVYVFVFARETQDCRNVSMQVFVFVCVCVLPRKRDSRPSKFEHAYILFFSFSCMCVCLSEHACTLHHDFLCTSCTSHVLYVTCLVRHIFLSIICPVFFRSLDTTSGTWASGPPMSSARFGVCAAVT
jgi:hypothetical protein